MNNVVPIFKCRRCGAAGRPVDTALDGEVVASGYGCSSCVEKTTSELARVRPIFDAMIAAGVDRVLANDTMTFLLTRLNP